MFAALLLATALRADDGFWTSDELRRIDEGLALLNLARKDLGFQKRPIDDPFRLKVVDRALDDPLSVGAEAQSWDEVARGGDPAAILLRALRALDGEPFTPRPEPGSDAAAPAQFPAGALDAYRRLVAVARAHHDALGAKAAPFAEVAAKAFATQVEAPSPLVPKSAMEDAPFLEAVRGFPHHDFVGAAAEIAAAARALGTTLRALPSSGPPWKGVVRIEDPRGAIVVAGHGDDLHDEGDDVAIVLDLGGNDTWLRGARATAARPVAVVIDVSGNDRYAGGNDLSFGAALGGVAVQWDGEGDDDYRAGHASLGAAILGAAALLDERGDDSYRGKDFGCGAAAFGAALLLDRAGNDLYHADLFGQGFASTRGCGVLADLEGQDAYDAGGTHLHAPLFHDRYQSLSQGFSIGMRPDASGGVGVLVDAKGNDRYACDIYGQGASYWYALGLLVDGEGNDTYVLGQYGQGSGIHLAAGMLLDRAGQDLYYDMHGVGQGGAHDYSVGFLVDRGGDDHYCGSGGTQGGALTNSVAMLLDASGNDGYTAVKIDGAQGSASFARGTGGIGLLLDGAGRDLYSELTRDGAAWSRDWIGAGLDEPTPKDRPAENPQAPRLTREEAEKALEKEGKDLDGLWRIACRWEVGDNQVIVPLARERLRALGAPALERAFGRIGTKDGLEYRAVETTLARFPIGEVLPRLLEKSRDPDAMVRKGAVRVIAALAPPEAFDRLAAMLDEDPANRGGVLAALASLRRAPPAVAALLLSPKEAEGVQAAVCLGAVGDDASIAALLGVLGEDAPFPVRVAATERLASLGAKAAPALSRLAGDPAAGATARRNALRALGRSSCAAAAAAIGPLLAEADPMVRLSALQAAADLLAALPPAEGEALRAAHAAARARETDPRLARLR